MYTYDPTHKYGFVADYAGTITVLKLDVSEFRFVTTLNGHQSECILPFGYPVFTYSNKWALFRGAHHFTSLYQFYLGSVRCLTYDRERRILFSGGFDQVVILWDIGSQKGTAYELTGHK